MGNASEVIGKGSTLRKVKFFDSLQHAKTKHFFGNGKYSLKVLDPKGNPDKWMQYINKLATTGEGTVRQIPTGELLEIKGIMPKTGGGNLSIGVRLFKPKGSDIWQLNTVLTRQ